MTRWRTGSSVPAPEGSHSLPRLNTHRYTGPESQEEKVGFRIRLQDLPRSKVRGEVVTQDGRRQGTEETLRFPFKRLNDSLELKVID